MSLIPAGALPRVSMKRIVLHWTAGTSQASALDRNHYHYIVEHRDGVPQLVGGVPIERNARPVKSGYAAHTRNLNTESIGVAVAGMGGAREAPFDAGRWPIVEAQIDMLVDLCRELAAFYDIPITRETVLSHGEVQRVLGVAQRGKWDILRLAFRPDLIGPHAVNDWIRTRIADGAASPAPPPAPMPMPLPEAGRGVVRGDTPTTTRAGGPKTGALPAGTAVTLAGEAEGDAVRVRTPAGYVVWVPAAAIEILDGPPADMPTTPSPARLAIAEAQDALDRALAALG